MVLLIRCDFFLFPCIIHGKQNSVIPDTTVFLTLVNLGPPTKLGVQRCWHRAPADFESVVRGR